MKIHRSATDENGTRYRNELLQDERLSLAACGLLVDLLSRPDGWEGTADEISREARQSRGAKIGESRAGIRKLFAELERCGYMVRKRTRDAQGRIVTVLEVHDIPQESGAEPNTAAVSSPMYPKGEYLYRHWDEKGRLLYVGVATNPRQRERRHAASSPWMEFQTGMTVERFETRAEAEAAESTAIEKEQPLFNVAGNETPEARQRLVEYLTARGRIDLLAPAVSRS